MPPPTKDPDPADLCQQCHVRRRIRKEKYCYTCRQYKILEMRSAGYLVTIPRDENKHHAPGERDEIDRIEGL